jgi:hypothetical protein
VAAENAELNSAVTAVAQGPHPRDAELLEARKELILFFNDWAVRHKLTALEYLRILVDPFGAQIDALALAERAKT